ncbi:MAG TPA: hypothetical protein VF613_20775 [Longimicrobium sp.]|jgi:hypothetical protein
MASPVTLWLQGVSQDIQRRLDRAEALAREDLVETHALLARDLVVVLAPRMPFDEAIDRYIEIMDLEGDDAEAVGTRAVALLDDADVRDDLAREGHRGWGFDWRYATPLGALRYIRRQRKRSGEEQLWMELAAARSEEAIAEMHMRHALTFVDLLGDEADPTRAVSLYVDRLDLPEARARIVYQRVMARLADVLLPRLHAPPPAEATENSA